MNIKGWPERKKHISICSVRAGSLDCNCGADEANAMRDECAKAVNEYLSELNKQAVESSRPSSQDKAFNDGALAMAKMYEATTGGKDLPWKSIKHKEAASGGLTIARLYDLAADVQKDHKNISLTPFISIFIHKIMDKFGRTDGDRVPKIKCNPEDQEID